MWRTARRSRVIPFEQRLYTTELEGLPSREVLRSSSKLLSVDKGTVLRSNVFHPPLTVVVVDRRVAHRDGTIFQIDRYRAALSNVVLGRGVEFENLPLERPARHRELRHD